ncbi:MAG: hypothetical protein PWR27_1137 [Petroclostridium sp.]|nr:hypothetical protein [Petroclostridium sp.]
MARILILANSDLGLYKFRKELIEELLIENEVYISLPNGDYIKDLVQLGCKFIETEIDRRGVNPLKELKLIFRYMKIFNIVNPDLTITYTIKPNIYGGFLSRFHKVKYATNITGLGSAFQNNGVLKKMIIKLYKSSLKKSNVAFFENEDNMNNFIQSGITSLQNSCKLNGSGVNLEEYNFVKYPFKDEFVRFLYIGRIMKEKGIDELLYVAKRIKSENRNAQFEIVGPEEEKYTPILNQLEEQGILVYHGYQEDVKPFIKRSHCFVLPSYHEGMANTLLECGAMGRPIITSDVPGCREAVLDGENGYLTRVRDSEQLYQNIVRFMNNSNDEKEIMGLKSRQYIEKNFSRNLIVAKTLERLADI